MRQICVITGPTATGKTALGIELALRLGGEVVSADSMQVYKRMDIGTAKPTFEEMRGVPHFMLSIVEPTESYCAARYVEDASRCVDDILSRGRLPIVVGGTGLYIDSLVSGRSFAEAEDGGGTRARLSAEYDDTGGEKMLAKLATFDSDRAKKLHPGDRRRIVRAIEVYELTGKTITQHDKETKKLPPRYDAKFIELSFEDRQALYSRIDARVDSMMRLGLEDEVRALLRDGVARSCTAMQAIGYKELAAAFYGECGLSEAVETIKRESRRYAKRQLTWTRSREGMLRIRWEDVPNITPALISGIEKEINDECRSNI